MFKFRIHLPTVYSLLILGVHVLALRMHTKKKINKTSMQTVIAQSNIKHNSLTQKNKLLA